MGARAYRRAGRVPWDFRAGDSCSHPPAFLAVTRSSPGVNDTSGHPHGEAPEGHDEDGEAEDEPNVHASERGLFVFRPLRLVVLLRLLHSALPALLERVREVTRTVVHLGRWQGDGRASATSRDRAGGERASRSRLEPSAHRDTRGSRGQHGGHHGYARADTEKILLTGWRFQKSSRLKKAAPSGEPPLAIISTAIHRTCAIRRTGGR